MIMVMVTVILASLSHFGPPKALKSAKKWSMFRQIYRYPVPGRQQPCETAYTHARAMWQ